MSAEIQQLRGALSGESVFILGNGPSLRELSLDRLRGRRVIGMNASTLLEEPHGFCSDYYVVSDARFLNHPEKRAYATSLVQSQTVRVLRADLRADDEPALRERTIYVNPLARNGFSTDLRRGFYFGCTTAMLAVQLAFHLGCARIYLLGCDFRYAGSQQRFYPESAPQRPDPFLSVQLWNLRNAYLELQKRGVALFGCSASSYLRPYVPYMSFADAVAEGEHDAALGSAG